MEESLEPRTERPRLQAPPGTCDTHMHIYGPETAYPVASTSPFPPPTNATVDAYRGVMERLDIHRVVVVQPSAYGKDNRCTMDAVAALGPAARGIVVVDSDTSDAELERLGAAGARGIRFHMLPGGVLPWEILERMAARAADRGWHIQLQLDGRLLPEREALIRRLPCPVVIDHTGKFLVPVADDHPSFRCLLGLVGSGNVWVKLSAPYETSVNGAPDFSDVGALARRLIGAAPERMFWASNWPHPSVKRHDARPDDAMLLDVLLDWCPDSATRQRILVDNPGKFYGFA